MICSARCRCCGVPKQNVSSPKRKAVVIDLENCCSYLLYGDIQSSCSSTNYKLNTNFVVGSQPFALTILVLKEIYFR